MTANYESFDASSGMLWGVGPEIGHLAAIIGFVAAVVLGLLGHLGAATRRKTWIENAGSVAVLQLVALVFAFAMLVHAFLVDDYSVVYVAANSNALLPWYYKVSAVWGARRFVSSVDSDDGSMDGGSGCAWVSIALADVRPRTRDARFVKYRVSAFLARSE